MCQPLFTLIVVIMITIIFYFNMVFILCIFTFFFNFIYIYIFFYQLSDFQIRSITHNLYSVMADQNGYCCSSAGILMSLALLKPKTLWSKTKARFVAAPSLFYISIITLGPTRLDWHISEMYICMFKNMDFFFFFFIVFIVPTFLVLRLSRFLFKILLNPVLSRYCQIVPDKAQ